MTMSDLPPDNTPGGLGSPVPYVQPRTGEPAAPTPPRSGSFGGIAVIFLGLVVAAIGSLDCGVNDTADCVVQLGTKPFVFGAGVLLVVLGVALLTGLVGRGRAS